jgi:nucleoside-diphosphate-sugar epimerase
VSGLPETVDDVDALDELLTRPSRRLVEFAGRLDGDVMILGASGKVGPTLVRMARRALDEADSSARVFAVARSRDTSLGLDGVEAISCDLMDPASVRKLPRAANVIYLVGRKFGSTGAEHLTWATNILPATTTASTLRDSRFVAFSTGCVYPIVEVDSGGVTEETPPAPIGEYAMSCLARERMFDYHSREQGLKVLHFRLNYAVDLRYGVLVDLARRVWAGEAVDVTTGHVNVIWQGDACERAILCLGLTQSPPVALNVTGLETLSVRDLTCRLGQRMGKPVSFVGEENGRGYLSDAKRSCEYFGRPSVPIESLIRWTADWVASGREILDKPTHFETQDGQY